MSVAHGVGRDRASNEHNEQARVLQTLWLPLFNHWRVDKRYAHLEKHRRKLLGIGSCFQA